jgi:hypothetical protein
MYAIMYEWRGVMSLAHALESAFKKRNLFFCLQTCKSAARVAVAIETLTS